MHKVIKVLIREKTKIIKEKILICVVYLFQKFYTWFQKVEILYLIYLSIIMKYLRLITTKFVKSYFF